MLVGALATGQCRAIELGVSEGLRSGRHRSPGNSYFPGLHLFPAAAHRVASGPDDQTDGGGSRDQKLQHEESSRSLQKREPPLTVSTIDKITIKNAVKVTIKFFIKISSIFVNFPAVFSLVTR